MFKQLPLYLALAFAALTTAGGVTITETRSYTVASGGEEVPKEEPHFLEFVLAKPWTITSIDSVKVSLRFEGGIDVRDFLAVLNYKDDATAFAVLFDGLAFTSLGGAPVTQLDVDFEDGAPFISDAVPGGVPLSVSGTYSAIDGLDSAFLGLDPSSEDWVLYVSYIPETPVNSTFLMQWDLTITGDAPSAVPDGLGWAGPATLAALAITHMRLRAKQG